SLLHRHLHSFPTRRSSDLHSIIVLLRAKPQRPSAYFFENFDEGPDERLSVSRGFTNESIGSVAKKISVGISDASHFPASHRMAPDRKSTRLNSSHLVISYA